LYTLVGILINSRLVTFALSGGTKAGHDALSHLHWDSQLQLEQVAPCLPHPADPQRAVKAFASMEQPRGFVTDPSAH
jgi:hypothetical protein